MASGDYWVNGFLLNSLGYQVDSEDGVDGLPDRVLRSIAVPGLDGGFDLAGESASGAFGLSMWVDGTVPGTGLYPADPAAQYQANLDLVRRNIYAPGDLDVQREMPDGTIRRSYCVLGPVKATKTIGGRYPACRLVLPFIIQRGYWSGLNAVAKSFVGGTQLAAWNTLADINVSTAPINDAILRLTGPALNPVIETDGCKVQLLGSLPAGDAWIVDSANFRSKVGTGITTSNQGTSVLKTTAYSGALPYLFKIWNPYRVRVTAANMTTATTLTVNAFPKFL